MPRVFFVLVLLLSVIISCRTEKKQPPQIDYGGFSEKKIWLVGFDKDVKRVDTLGLLSIKIPARLDTFYQWHRSSDCLPCGSFRYRFADSKYIQFAERGFFWTYTPDSIYQFTITHSPIRVVPDSINLHPFTTKDTLPRSYLQQSIIDYSNEKYIRHMYKEINGRGAVISNIISPVGEISQDTTLYLTASIRLNKFQIDLIAECGAKDTVGFVDNMYKSILSIKIQEK